MRASPKLVFEIHSRVHFFSLFLHFLILWRFFECSNSSFNLCSTVFVGIYNLPLPHTKTFIIVRCFVTGFVHCIPTRIPTFPFLLLHTQFFFLLPCRTFQRNNVQHTKSILSKCLSRLWLLSMSILSNIQWNDKSLTTKYNVNIFVYWNIQPSNNEPFQYDSQSIQSAIQCFIVSKLSQNLSNFLLFLFFSLVYQRKNKNSTISFFAIAFKTFSEQKSL